MKLKPKPMSFQDAVKFLGIEDYGKRIWNSSSTGELFHLYDYVVLASDLKKKGTHKEVAAWFRPRFELCVKFAEERWSRPESCFQHMPVLLDELNKVIDSRRKELNQPQQKENQQ